MTDSTYLGGRGSKEASVRAMTGIGHCEALALQVLDAIHLVEAWRDKVRRYHTTLTACDCMDSQIRGGKCKNQILMRLLAEQRGHVQ